MFFVELWLAWLLGAVMGMWWAGRRREEEELAEFRKSAERWPR
jgi:hypothetical protein